MIEKWSKVTEGGNVVWKKQVVGASNANNIVVTNPEVTSEPDDLNSVLGKMKGNINELYGNVKWLALHGGGGAGTGGGGGSEDTPSSAYLMFVQITNLGETSFSNNDTLSVSEDEITIGIYLYGAQAERKYYVTAKSANDMYISNKELTRLSNYCEIKVSNIVELENLKIAATLRDDEGVSYPTTYLNVNYASVNIDAWLIQDNSKIEKGSSVVSKKINDDFEVSFNFSTSIIGGNIQYTISAPSLYDDNNKGLNLSGTVENGDSISVNFSEGYNFQISRSYEIKVSAKVVSYIDGQIITLASTMFLFNAQKLNEDDLFVTFSDKRWKLLENSFDEYLWEDGQDAILDSVLVGNKNYYNDIYYVAKFSYERGIGGGQTEWKEIPSGLISGYGYFEDDDESTPDFLTSSSKESYKTVKTQEDKKSWLRQNNSTIESWKNANRLRNFSITSNYGTNASVFVSYPVISSISDLFNFNIEKTVDEETGVEVYNDKLVSNGSGDVAHVRADLFAFNLKVENVEHIIIPLEVVDDEVVYKPTLSVKTRIKKSAQSVPNFTKGVQHGIIKSGKTEYIETESQIFNFDAIGPEKTMVSSTLNTISNAKYSSKQSIGGVEYSIPMYMNNCNGTTEGRGNSGIVNIEKYSEIDNKPLILNGEKVKNTYTVFRVSGNSYGQINYDSVFKKGLDFSSATTKTSGFTISLVFQSDWHSHNNGTIFSMGDYTSDGTLITGINVDLEEAKFVIGENVDNKTTTATIKLIQNEFTQLDFVYEYSKVGSGASSVEYGIIKIYQNGIRTGIASLTFPSKSDLVFANLVNGITIGCKAIAKGSVFGTNFTDANIFGLRIYNQALTDCEIVKNKMISFSLANLGWEKNDKELYDAVVDYDNVVSPQLKKNYFNDVWISSIWDYGNGRTDKTKVASGQKLFESLSAWIQPERGDGYRILPIVYLHNNDEICSTINQSSDNFYKVYNETTASINNKYIDNKQFQNCFEGIFDYYDTTAENPVSSATAMKGHKVAWYMQGTSTQANRSKNIEVCFENDVTNPEATGDIGWEKEGVGRIEGEGDFLFTPKPSKWLPENRFTLKADVVDSGHANNAAIGGWINDSGFMPKNPVQQDDEYEYKDFVKATLEGFPVLVFVNWGYKMKADGTKDESFQEKNGVQFLGIYSFNLGRGSYFNLGFKKFHRYELAVNGNKNIPDNTPERWSDPRNCPQASFVSRYLLEEENPNIFSFESTSNEPVGAVSFEQPNISLIEKLWDVKYKSESADKAIGYARLQQVIKNIAYFNNDNLNYFGQSSIPEYYYSSGSVTSTGNIGLIAVLRNVEDFRDYQIGLSTPEGTQTTEIGGSKIYTFPNGKKYKEDNLRWYEGLRDFENEDFSCKGLNTSRNSVGKFEIFDEGGNFLPCFYREQDTSQELLSEMFPDRLTEDENKTISKGLGYYAEWAGGDYVQFIDRTPKHDDDTYSTQWIHYSSFSRYFIIAMMFGMVDSLGKNFTLRTWNLTDAQHGTLLPAFYDMDTALGLDNAGAENVDPTVYMDYWLTQNTKEGTLGESALHIFTEDVPYLTQSSDGQYYEFYDKQDGICLARYAKTENYPPLPQTTQYDLPKSHLWHIIRFMPELYSNLDDYNSGAGSATKSSVPAWAPLGQYTALRNSFLHSVDEFFEGYYLKHSENVGEFVFNLDYAEKYQTAYKKEGDDTLTYGDMRFCHGRRTSYVKQWLETRMTFLDSVLNLGHKLTMCNSNTKGGIEYLRNYEASGTAYRFFFHDPNQKTLSSDLISLNPVYITETGNKIGKTTNQAINSYSFVITTNENIMLILNFTNTIYHCFVRRGVPTLFKVVGFKANSPGLTFNINATATISEWEGFKSLNLYNFNSKAPGANWNLISFDLSPDVELGVLGNSLQQHDALQIEGMTELRTLNLSGISSGSNYVSGVNLSTMSKLQYLDISNSAIQSISFPTGGNLQTLKMEGCSLLAGELKLENLGSLEGTLSLKRCSKITSVIIKNCPKLKNIEFGQNDSLTNIEIDNCPSLESFYFNGGVTTTNTDTLKECLIEKISITGNCVGLKSCTIENIPSTKFELDLSGVIGLKSLNISNTQTFNMPILPEYYKNGEVDLVKSDYPIYNDVENVSISLANNVFRGFRYGKDRNVIGYQVSYGTDEYPKFVLGNENTIEPNEVVLNLATFPKISYLSLSKCPNIRYVACNPEYTVTGLNLMTMPSLERMFGKFVMYSNGSVFGYKSLDKFRVCDWNNYDPLLNKSTVDVKEMFEVVMDDPDRMSEFLEMMHDSYEEQESVQGAFPYTRFTLPKDTQSLENAFNSTSVSMNDVYYIMLIANLNNKETKKIESLAKMFQGCGLIQTNYTSTSDTSPSHYLFKYLYTVKTISNVFGGCQNMNGILYSPDYTIGDDGTLTDKQIGILTPFVLTTASFADMGWNLSLYDDYAYWTPTGTEVYYDSTLKYSGTCEKIVNVNGILNNVSCINSAIYNDVDTGKTYFRSSLLLKSFHKASVISNSFNGISVDFSQNENRTQVYQGKYYTYSTLLKGMTELTSILNSFNSKLAANTVVVDIFAGNPYSLNNEKDEYPNQIKNIEGSFVFTCATGQAYFVLTDDMFQRISKTIEVISPSFNKDGIYTLTNESYGTFSGTRIVKTYVKYHSDGTVSDAKFPYGIFRNCENLQQIPCFFSDLDLRYYINATNKTVAITYEDFESPYVLSVLPNQSEYELQVPIPDYYSSLPYTKVEDMEGNVEHDAVLRLFKDNKKLTNISALFNRMKPVRMGFSIGETKRYIPGSFVLTSNGLKGLTKLINVQYLFADNHYFKGFVPYSLLNTDDILSRSNVELKGSDDLNQMFNGLENCSVNVTSFIEMRQKDNHNEIQKGSLGILPLMNQVYGGYVFIPDAHEFEDAYVVSMQTMEDPESGESYQMVETIEQNGMKFPKFVQCDFSNFAHRQQQRYRRVSVSDILWYQTYNPSLSNSGSVETKMVDFLEDNNTITNMSYLMYKNDAAGFLPLRYSNDFDNYTKIYANPSADDSDYFRRCNLYKWNSYQADDFIHTKTSGKYSNKNMFCENRDYSPFKLLVNNNRNDNLTCVYEKFKDKDGTLLDIVFINGDYDPRQFVLNNNTNRLAFNKFVMDGRWLTDSDLNEIVESGLRYIIPSDDVLKTESNSVILTDFVYRQIPDKWFNKQMSTHTPLSNQPNQEHGIFYATDEISVEKTVSDSSLRPLLDNELPQLIELKKDMNYFCPSDIFNYISSTNGIIKYAFAKTNFQFAKASSNKYQKMIYEGTDNLNVELTTILKESLTNGNDKNVNSVGYYLEGNAYTGIPGRVSPMLFDKANTFTTIEGVFMGNPQLSPFSYSTKTTSGVDVNGWLFDSDTFRPLTQLKSNYLLWANNIVPKQVNIDPMTFRYNTNLQYLDYMFAGTLWFSTDDDINRFGTQIPDQIFNGLSYIKSARSAFMSPINYIISIDEGASITHTGNVSGGEPSNAGDWGELSLPQIGIGSYGVKWVSDDLFEDSKDSLQMVSNMFFFDQNLKNYPNIYDYDNFKDNLSRDWNSKMYHTAYYVGKDLDEFDKVTFGPNGKWGLRTVEQSKDNGNKVYYQSSSFSSQLN